MKECYLLPFKNKINANVDEQIDKTNNSLEILIKFLKICLKINQI